MWKFFKFYGIIIMWIMLLFAGLFCVNTSFYLISAPSTADVFFGIFLLIGYIHLFVGVTYATVKSLG